MLKISQKDLMDFLNKNPIKAPAYLGETNVKDSSSYIFVDNPLDEVIASDNGGLYLNTVLISIYTTDFDERNQLVSFLRSKFIGSVSKTKEDEYFKAVFEMKVFVDEW